MTVKLPLIVVLALIVWLLMKRSGLKAGHAVTCALFGFYLRDTTLAPSISEAVQRVVGVIGSIAP